MHNKLKAGCVGTELLDSTTYRHLRIVIFFSLTEAPLPDPTQHPETDPKQTRNRPETDPNGPKRTRNGPKRPEIMDRNQGLWGGTAGGFVGMGGWGL